MFGLRAAQERQDSDGLSPRALPARKVVGARPFREQELAELRRPFFMFWSVRPRAGNEEGFKGARERVTVGVRRGAKRLTEGEARVDFDTRRI
jgi:hypothetical protein